MAMRCRPRTVPFAALLAILLASQAPEASGNEAESLATSFEEALPGGVAQLVTPVGKWTPGDGRTIIDDKHSKTGKQCLQLTGGKKTSAFLQIPEGTDTSGILTFWAERWTSRNPFMFRIEKRTGVKWEEIYNGDTKVRVGRSFLNHVRVQLGEKGIRELRFTVSSPPDTGVLVDDVRIEPAQPQKVEEVAVVPMTLPALVGLEYSPLAKLRIETSGALDPVSLVGLRGEVRGEGVSSVRVVGVEAQVGKDGMFAIRIPKGGVLLDDGENFIMVEGMLPKGVDIDGLVGVSITEASLSNGQSYNLDATPSLQRLGVAVRKHGDDGVHTYRIPGLATTNKGTLLGVYDIRRGSGGDLPGNIDVGMSRSINGGRTWEPMKVIIDMGDDPKWNYDGIGDPAILVDRNTGTIWVAATWSHGNRSWRGSGPGLEPEETGQLILARSEDDGVTWSEPINITKQVKRPEWCFLLQGPGKGITMQDGTIVFAAQYQDSPEKKRLPHSTILYSKDHGKTWQVGTGAFDDTTEAQVVESEPGVLMLNCRYNRDNTRVVMTTRDMGKTWQNHPTSRRALIEPKACMASLVDAGGWLLFSNPDSTTGRHHITIKSSPDRGLTWPKENRLLLDEGKGAGYSCMTMVDDRTVGILYEGSQAQMTFQRIRLCDLIRREEKLHPAIEDARLQMPQVFGDHMVLQSGVVIPVWGSAKPGAKVKVNLGKQGLSTTANMEGKWSVRMQPREASWDPVCMTVESMGDHIKFTNILVGEVWLCAGQSNMEWPLRQSTHGNEEFAEANHPGIRLLNLVGGTGGGSASYSIEHLSRLIPKNFCQGNWEVSEVEKAGKFSAVAWYFGRQLHEELGVPVGLICSALGGTPTESWVPREALEADPDLQGLAAGFWLDNPRLGEFCRVRGEQNLVAAMQAGEAVPRDVHGPNHPFKPGFMWSAGIEPLAPYAIRGAIWYQGESNAETGGRVREHAKLFPLMVQQWRQNWGQGDFPFLYVQLPALDRPAWPEFRDGQRRMLSQIQNVGMAVTIDTGLPGNVHPPLKKPVGERLARWALGTTYKREKYTTFSGPIFLRAERKDNSIMVKFLHTGNGLMSSDGDGLRHFEIRGKDGQFVPAKAKVTSKDTLSVTSPGVTAPSHVRYAWLPFPHPSANLVNSTGLPASPFTTEDNHTILQK